MVKILFEDNISQPVSELLRKTAGEDCVYFSFGNRELVTLARLMSDNKQEVYCYVDMVWDNSVTEDIYSDLLDLASVRNNLHVLRIPCIEFTALTMLYLTGVYNFGDSVGLLRYLNFGGELCKADYKDASFEKYCKGLLNGVKKPCLRNNNEGVSGKYYTEECPCGYQYCGNKVDLMSKGVSLVMLLPESDRISSWSDKLGEFRCLACGDSELYSRMWHSLYDERSE